MCPLCNGSALSRHVRRKHLAFLTSISSPQPTTPAGAHQPTDVGSDNDLN